MLPDWYKNWRARRRSRYAKPVLLEHGAIPWLLAVAIITTLPHIEYLPRWLSLFSAVLLLGRAWLWQKNARLPARWLLFLLAAAGTVGIVWQYKTIFGDKAGVALLVFLMTLKPMEMQRRRDGLIVIMLGFFLLLTHYLHSQSIPTAFLLLAATILLTATLVRINGGAQPNQRILGYAALLVVQSLPFMLIFLLLFPRVSGPLWWVPQETRAGLTGLSDRMSPGSLNELIKSGEIAFRVLFASDMPKKNQLYWRGPVLDIYDGQIWRASMLNAGRSLDPRSHIEVRGTAAADYTMTLEPHNQRWLLALDLPTVLPEKVALTSSFETRSQRRVHYRSRYTFRSVFDYVANRQESKRVFTQSLHLPADLDPKTRELAEEWQRKFKTSEDISAAALRFFREEKFFYTLTPPLLGQNAVDEFLFDSRRGFCGHYAGAYVVLMRAAGIPARVVTGYQGGEINPIDGYMVVRQSDAHAWAEIWVENKGWLRVDPTAAVAPSRIERGIATTLPETEALPALLRLNNDWLISLRYRWEAINNAWDQWFLGYTPERQRDVLSRLGLENPDWRSMAAIMTTLCGVALLLVTLWTLFRHVPVLPEQRAWDKYCQKLQRFGISRESWEGPFDFAARVARTHPNIGQLTQEAAHHFADLHYGSGGPEQLHALRDCAKRLVSRRRKYFEK